MIVSTGRFLAAAIAIALLAGIALQTTPATAQQGSGMDHPAVQAGLKKLGGHGGQCKMFARDVFAAVGVNIGSGYRQAYLNAGYEVSPDNAQAGDILQISNPANHERYYPGMHTVIVIENLGNRTYKVIDSNWRWDERVSVHEWKPRPAAPLQLYAYRFNVGSGSGSGASNPVPEDLGPAPDLSVGDTATVAADGSCLNLRTGAGTGNTSLDCLPTGNTVTVLSEAQSSNGYTWVKVRSSSGQEGWVASEYLTRASSAPAPEPDEPEEEVEPAPGSEQLSVGDTASVATDGSCLYLRDTSGLGGEILDCNVDGTTLTILSEPVTADGYTWVEVETRSGERGWSAREYMVPTN